MKISLFSVAIVSAAAIVFSSTTIARGDEPAAPRRVRVAGPLYTCKMHPEIRWSQPAACPLCDMKLVPVKDIAAANGQQPSANGHAMHSPGHAHDGMNHSGMHSGMGGCGMCMEMMGGGNMNHGAAPAASKVAPTRYRGGRGGCGC